MRIKKYCITLILLLLGSGVSRSQKSRTEIQIDFRVNSSVIDPAYNGNDRHLNDIVSFFERIKNDSTINITGITFCGTASPEGSRQLNRRLARNRLEALEKFIRKEVDIPDSLVTRNDTYISWEYLAGRVSDSDMSHKEEILAIINGDTETANKPEGEPTDDIRILSLRKLDGGKVWSELLQRFFAPMRNASVVFLTYKKELPPIQEPVIIPDTVATDPEPVIEVVEITPDTTAVVETVVPEAEEWTRRLYIKTNLVGLGLAIANAAVEVDLTKHWSVTLPIYYSAWDYFTSTVKFRTFAVQPEARYWFDENNDRWFVGAHLGLAYYNFATDGEYRTQDHDGTSPSLGGGLSVGYRLPISKDNHWRMEFSVGAGVYPLHYDKFHNTPNTKDGLMTESVKKTYWGIDQAAISLSYTFDLKKKGGRR